ncbi:hypothetical protein CcaverHIS641_0209620 [Cutaneotrichosporon cavernicola]|nr:hypothetical protein CcaverHIS641_0209620 [Cutaneotrichosporon cavernicola]
MATVSASRWTAPQWVNSLYAQFPLVTLEQEDVLDWRQDAARSASSAVYNLWTTAPSRQPTSASMGLQLTG